MPSRDSTPPPPPRWYDVATTLQLIAILVMFAMYAFKQLDCKRFVRLACGILACNLALALVAFWSVGGFRTAP